MSRLDLIIAVRMVNLHSEALIFPAIHIGKQACQVIKWRQADLSIPAEKKAVVLSMCIRANNQLIKRDGLHESSSILDGSTRPV